LQLVAVEDSPVDPDLSAKTSVPHKGTALLFISSDKYWKVTVPVGCWAPAPVAETMGATVAVNDTGWLTATLDGVAPLIVASVATCSTCLLRIPDVEGLKLLSPL
jgi:hypothetical protein